MDSQKILHIFFIFAFLSFCSCQDVEDPELVVPEQDSNNTGIYFNTNQNFTKIKGGTYRYGEWYTTLPGAHHAMYTLANDETAEIASFESDFISFFENDNITGRGSVNISALFIGFNQLNITIFDIDNTTLGIAHETISVLLPYQGLNTIFTYILSVLVGIVYINMGATLDLTVVKQIVKKPVGPLVGITCQYIFMPVIAFGLAKAFFPGNPLLQLGMFLNGASPGGGNSNMWTFLLGGSLDLSIMMTFTSTIFAFAAVPLWVLTLGPQIIGSDSGFTIPYSNIALIVVSLIVPCSLGVLLQKKFPKAAKFLETRVLAPFSVFNIVFIFSFGVYTHRYIFGMFTWRILLACFALPGLGYLSGLILSVLTKRTWHETIAISIETGVQNANIAIIILKFTLEPPVGDLAVVIPACCVLMTPIPLVLLLCFKKLHGHFFNSGGKDIQTDDVDRKPKIEVISNATLTQLPLPELNGKAKDTSYYRGHGIDNPSAIHDD